MRWHLLIEEFEPKVTRISRAMSNIIADALSRMRLTEADFSPEAFTGDINDGDFPTAHPLSYVIHSDYMCDGDRTTHTDLLDLV